MVDTRILIGKVAAAHGLRGEVKLKSFATDPLAMVQYPSLTFADGRVATVKSARVVGDFVIATLSGVADRSAAEGMRGAEIFVERADLPEPAEDEFYLADLIGCTVSDPAGSSVGEVIAVPSYGAGDILEIRIGASRATALVPFTRDFAPIVEVARRRIVLSASGLAAMDGDDKSEDMDQGAVA